MAKNARIGVSIYFQQARVVVSEVEPNPAPTLDSFPATVAYVHDDETTVNLSYLDRCGRAHAVVGAQYDGIKKGFTHGWVWPTV